MERPERHGSVARALRVWLASVLILPTLIGVAQSEVPQAEPLPDASRLDRLERTLNKVMEENRRLAEEVRTLKQQLATPPHPEPPPPVVDALPMPPPPAPSLPSAPAQEVSEKPPRNYSVDYDNGFVILPDDLDESPFSLKLNFQDMFRYDGFARAEKTWVDSAGNLRSIVNSNYFGVTRGRLIFSGKVFLPELSYLLNIDYNSVTSHPIGFRAYTLGYRFNRSVELFVGQSKVPGSREWLTSTFLALEGADRSMATTFFRPSLSQGIWLVGEPADGLHYYGMLSNGFNTQNLTPARLDARFCWSGSVWWEPWGEFGPGYADLENHQDPVIRVGASGTFAAENGSQDESSIPENAAIRLSDGTLITQVGAFAPGVTLRQFNIGLSAVDLAFKWRGLSLSAEGYLQTLSDLRGNGPIPIRSTRAEGGFIQGGYFVLPRRVELYGRLSAVTGKYGSGAEYAGGMNWFILPGKSNLRFTFDAAWLNHSPAEQSRTGFVAGQTGILIRSQIITSF